MIFPIPATVINAEVLHCLYFFRSAAALARGAHHDTLHGYNYHLVVGFGRLRLFLALNIDAHIN